MTVSRILGYFPSNILRYLKYTGGIIILYLLVSFYFSKTIMEAHLKLKRLQIKYNNILDVFENSSHHEKRRKALIKEEVDFYATDRQPTNFLGTGDSKPAVSLNNTSSCSMDDSLIDFGKKLNPVFNGNYLINNKSICCGSSPITVIVVVHTDPNHFVRRTNIRTTYGSRELFLPIEIRVIFLLGRVKSLQLQNDILREHSQYGDIIQGDFIDAYHNLTFKAVMGLHWVSHFCSKVKYVVKTDDDAIFDMWRFLKLVHAKNLYVSETIYGIVNHKGIIFRGGKWAVDPNFLKGEKYYPYEFCIGFVLIYSSNVIPALYRASYVAPFLWLDDVYVTGILRTAANITKIIQNGGNLQLIPEAQTGLHCLKVHGDGCPDLAVGVSESTYHQSWLFIKKRNQK